MLKSLSFKNLKSRTSVIFHSQFLKDFLPWNGMNSFSYVIPEAMAPKNLSIIREIRLQVCISSSRDASN